MNLCLKKTQLRVRHDLTTNKQQVVTATPVGQEIAPIRMCPLHPAPLCSHLTRTQSTLTAIRLGLCLL